MRFAQVPLSFNELPVSHIDLMIIHGLAILVFSMIVFVSMRYFVNAFQKEHSRAEKLVVDLSETNTELEATLNELKVTQSEHLWKMRKCVCKLLTPELVFHQKK